MDKSRLVEILKEAGLEVTEDVAIDIVKGVFKALPKVFQETENKYDDMVIPVLGLIEPKVLELLDGIDGHEG